MQNSQVEEFQEPFSIGGVFLDTRFPSQFHSKDLQRKNRTIKTNNVRLIPMQSESTDGNPSLEAVGWQNS
jgi:hypothetical protein